MNGLKSLLSAVLSLVSVITYATAGLIAWEPAVTLAIATTIGGYLGGHYARRIPPGLMRFGIILVGTVLTVVFFLQ